MTSGGQFVLASRAAERGVDTRHPGAVVKPARGRSWVVAGVLAAVLLAVGFGFAWKAAIWPLNQQSEAALARRAQYFWDLRLSGDYLGAYDHMIEAYRRRVGPAGFARVGGIVVWTGAKVTGVELDEKGGLVEIAITYRLAKSGYSDIESTSTVKERWVLEDGAWHRWPPEMGG